MSAFIVHDDLIDLLVTVAVSNRRHDEGLFVHHELSGHEACRFTEADADRIGQILVAENHLSVNYRYNEGDLVVPAYKWRPVRNVGGGDTAYIPWGHVLSALDCYEYQSCERPEWDDTLAKAVCDSLRKKVCRLIAGSDAPWEWTRSQADERWTNRAVA